MAVSKRLRYEIMLRDNHTCRYCGAHGARREDDHRPRPTESIGRHR
jgi:5-methylcytosine-specific restriction endonuclease McrA